MTAEEDHRRIMDLLQIPSLRQGADGRNPQAECRQLRQGESRSQTENGWRTTRVSDDGERDRLQWNCGPSPGMANLRLTAASPIYIFSFVRQMAKKRSFLGEFEIIVLLATLRLSDRAYGATISAEIQTRIRREVSIGALYATLQRLEDKGYVTSHMGEPTPERGGRAKRFFEVTASGRRAVNQTRRALQNMMEDLEWTLTPRSQPAHR
jgi:DNA-binding PadR family transcriptional regulator